MPLTIPTLLFLVFVVIAAPLAAYETHRQLQRGAPLPRRSIRFLGLIAVQVVLLALALAAARDLDLLAFSRGVSLGEAVAAGLLGAFLLAAGIWAWRVAPEERRLRLRLFAPQRPRELLYWAPISLLAGIAEEIAYRHVLWNLLWMWLGPGLLVPTLLAALLFSAAHAAQGLRSIPVIFAFALVFHALVYATGSLYPAMAVHVAYDFFFGVAIVMMGREQDSPMMNVD